MFDRELFVPFFILLPLAFSLRYLTLDSAPFQTFNLLPEKNPAEIDNGPPFSQLFLLKKMLHVRKSTTHVIKDI